jgi:uncharacterized protein YfaP (DUF2135 family)
MATFVSWRAQGSTRRFGGALAIAALAVACSFGSSTTPSPQADASTAGLDGGGATSDGSVTIPIEASADAGGPDATVPEAGADAATDATDDVTQTSEAGDARTSLDPAPTHATPGKYTDVGCPDTTTYDTAGYTMDLGDAGIETTETFAGTVTGNVGNGTYYVKGPNGEEIAGPVPTADDGTYNFTLPMFCGSNLVKLVWPSAACDLVIVLGVTRSDCVAADIQATISWDDIGLDWELHLIKPGGHINDNATDCTWTSCIGTSPDWGVQGDPSDDPHKDVDNTGYYGPENIYLDKPENGTYTIMVEHWGGGGASDGQLIVNVQGTTLTIPHTGLVSEHVWVAATIDWPSKVVTPMQTDVDCTSNWSGGCQMTIP